LYLGLQALITKIKDGISVTARSLYPIIVTIIQKTRKKFYHQPIATVLSRFNLMDKDKNTVQSIIKATKHMKVENVELIHCTGQEAQIIFKKS
jgi:metal-dependent hydrolase (beta-lactamase superfamily II)